METAAKKFPKLWNDMLACRLSKTTNHFSVTYKASQLCLCRQILMSAVLCLLSDLFLLLEDEEQWGRWRIQCGGNYVPLSVSQMMFCHLVVSFFSGLFSFFLSVSHTGSISFSFFRYCCIISVFFIPPYSCSLLHLSFSNWIDWSITLQEDL